MRTTTAAVIAALALCLQGVPAGAQEDTISLNLKGASLADAIDILHQQTGLQFIFGAGIEEDQKVTITIDNAPLSRVLRLLLEPRGLKAEEVEGVYLIQKADAGNGVAMPGGGPARPTRPGPAPTRPAPTRVRPGAMTGPARPTTVPGGERAEGTPTIASKRYERIYLQYAYAPGLAMALGGEPLLYSMIDPWASMSSSGGIGGGGGGFGGQGGGFGGGGFGGQGGGGFGGGGFGGQGGGGFGGGGFGGQGGGGFGGGGFGGGGRGGGGFGF